MLLNRGSTKNIPTLLSIISVEGNEQIWRRDCSDGLPDGFVGCKTDSRSNGTMTWEIEICVCKDNLCNKEMGDISSTTSSTNSPTTTTTHKSKNKKYA